MGFHPETQGGCLLMPPLRPQRHREYMRLREGLVSVGDLHVVVPLAQVMTKTLSSQVLSARVCFGLHQSAFERDGTYSFFSSR